MTNVSATHRCHHRVSGAWGRVSGGVAVIVHGNGVLVADMMSRAEHLRGVSSHLRARALRSRMVARRSHPGCASRVVVHIVQSPALIEALLIASRKHVLAKSQ